jgi:hypothetical protein
MPKNPTVIPNNLYGVVDINDDAFETKLIKSVKAFGVVVIKNVMTSNECDSYTEQTLGALEKLSDFKRTDLKTWSNDVLPQQVRPGMFHEVICNLPSINRIRFNTNIIRIFKTYYSSFKNTDYKDTDLVVSNDGLNIKPGIIPPFENGIDWAHVDQTTDLDDPYKCIQGQMVLSNTSACFRASPKSHLLFEEFVQQADNNTKKGNFLKFKPEQYASMKIRLESIGGSWQIKIPANKGDFIIWTSSTVHSATLQEKPERPTNVDRFNGWRHVVFVCYRPREEFTEHELRTKYQGFLGNRTSNHWGTTIFPKGFNKFSKKENYSETIRKFIEKPEEVYKVNGLEPNLSKEQKIMMGLCE